VVSQPSFAQAHSRSPKMRGAAEDEGAIGCVSRKCGMKETFDVLSQALIMHYFDGGFASPALACGRRAGRLTLLAEAEEHPRSPPVLFSLQTTKTPWRLGYGRIAA
jgi:hypothetical protein